MFQLIDWIVAGFIYGTVALILLGLIVSILAGWTVVVTSLICGIGRAIFWLWTWLNPKGEQ